MNSELTKLDKFLDEALKSYSEAEPRIGFESRIIANLRVAPAQPRWELKFAYASAAIVVVCVMFYGAWRLESVLVSHRPEIAPRAIANQVPAPEVARTNPWVVSSAPIRKRPLKQVQSRRTKDDHQQIALASQLPVPTPLSQQEKLLLAFARENPKEVATTVEWQERMREPAEQPTVSDRGEQQ